MQTLGFAMCGSFCTLDRAMEQMAELSGDYALLPIMSENVYTTDTRFGKAADFIRQGEKTTGRKVLHTIVEVEPLGPKGLVDAMVVCPCTGNTLSKLALGITDTPVTMAVKSSLRVGLPVVICLASNDALAASGQNAARLMNTKNVYFVPLRQDDPVKKPFSLVADFSLLKETVAAALAGRQLQPIFV
ncbi:dipicolinate synthase subunit B [Acutalibacter intestini]|uniref:dipicolinate synthase subunit B n=1 Tax=Acutalibacter intestini TaxID=3093659 RepID=UPI002AC9297E|nr:dipicolinate synthase subunit B [Acutalibacter sp. M00204]